jgi:hypothetical protein
MYRSIYQSITIAVATIESGNRLNLAQQQELLMNMNARLIMVQDALENMEIRQRNTTRLLTAPHQCLPLQKRVRLILYATLLLSHCYLNRMQGMVMQLQLLSRHMACSLPRSQPMQQKSELSRFPSLIRHRHTHMQTSSTLSFSTTTTSISWLRMESQLARTS